MICQKSTSKISCPSGQKIVVLWANWGRRHADKDVCQTENKISLVTDCIFVMTEFLQEQCGGNDECELSPHWNLYGDPCTGESKYLEIVYICLII